MGPTGACVVTAAVLGLSACASLAPTRSGAPPLREPFAAAQLLDSGRPPQDSAALFTVDWHKSLVDPEFLEWTPREFSQPAVDDSGRVYVASRDGRVRAFDVDGARLWTRKIKGPFFGGITVSGGQVLVPSGDGVLWSLATEDGSVRWSYRAGEELGTRPVVSGGLVYVASFSNSVFAVDLETGAWKWQYRRDVAAEFAIRGASTPAVDGKKLFMGFSDGAAVCLDATDGTVDWSHPLSTARQFPDADAAPQLDGQGHVIFASYQGGVFSLDEASGATVWQSKLTGVTQLTADEGTLYAGGAGAITALTLEGGQTRWTLHIPDGYAGPASLLSRYVLVPTTQALVFVDRDTGEPRRVFNPGRGISAPPAVGRDGLYVLSNTGTLYALSLARPL